MAQIQFSLTKKSKDCTSRILTKPYSPSLTPPQTPPCQSGRHKCITPFDLHSFALLPTYLEPC